MRLSLNFFFSSLHRLPVHFKFLNHSTILARVPSPDSRSLAYLVSRVRIHGSERQDSTNRYTQAADTRRRSNMASQKPMLSSLLLRTKPPSHLEYTIAVSSISSWNLDIFQDESNRDSILMHADRVLSRLQKLFEGFQQQNLSQDVSERLVRGLVLPLIQDDEPLITVDQAFPLIGAALPSVTKSSSSCIREVAKILLDVDGLLDRLLSHELYIAVLKAWFSSKNTQLDKKLVKRFTDKLVGMCDNCTSDHGIQAACHEWHTVKALMESLTTLAHSIENEEIKQHQKSRDIPLLAGMRMLDREDKKTHRARQAKQRELSVPEPTLMQLSLLGINKPESLRALQIIQQELESEKAMSILRTVIDTYPCRLCWETVTGKSSLSVYDFKVSENTKGSSVKSDLFGKRIGLWKVLLTDRAFKSSRKLARTGTSIPNSN